MRVSICISMGLPFGDGRCENPIIKLAGNPTIFDTRRHQNRRTSLSSGDFLPVTLATRGKTRSLWCAGAVGAFYLLHACSVFFLPVCVTPKHP